MTQVISLVAPPKAITPAHSSPMELDDHDGPRAIRAATDTPDSPSPRTVDPARKRAASINTAEANYARFEHLRLNTPTNMNKDSPRDHICLCTPAPKIPRPRNGESRIFFVVIVFVVVVIGAPRLMRREDPNSSI